jgi:hypothetical protein
VQPVRFSWIKAAAAEKHCSIFWKRLKRLKHQAQHETSGRSIAFCNLNHARSEAQPSRCGIACLDGDGDRGQGILYPSHLFFTPHLILAIHLSMLPSPWMALVWACGGGPVSDCCVAGTSVRGWDEPLLSGRDLRTVASCLHYCTQIYLQID